TGKVVQVSFGSGTVATGELLGLGEMDGLGETLVGLGDPDELACGPPQLARASTTRIPPPSFRTPEA
ncbi:MAG TPA: hypothetical protein VIJ30_03005, partial [Candidatus Dormibacteraeota bacterium]